MEYAVDVGSGLGCFAAHARHGGTLLGGVAVRLQVTDNMFGDHQTECVHDSFSSRLIVSRVFILFRISRPPGRPPLICWAKRRIEVAPCTLRRSRIEGVIGKRAASARSSNVRLRSSITTRTISHDEIVAQIQFLSLCQALFRGISGSHGDLRLGFGHPHGTRPLFVEVQDGDSKSLIVEPHERPCTASVDLPTPPFVFANTSFMSSPIAHCQHSSKRVF